MPLARGSQAGLAYVPEVTYGTTPVTPALIEVLTTGFSPEVTKESGASADIRSDRQVADLRHGRKSTSFGVNFTYKHGEFDAFLESALFGAWATNVLKAGVTRKSFTLEAQYKDIGRFHAYNGCLANSFALSLSADAAEVTGSFGFVGLDMTPAAASIDIGGNTPAGAKRAFDGFNGSLSEGGAGLAIVTGVELTLDNGITPANVLFQNTPAEMLEGRTNLTGTVTAFFEDDSLLNKFLNETPSSLDFTLTDPDGNTHAFLVPRIIYSGGSAPVDGEGPVVVTMPFTATFDTVTGTSLQVTRSA